MINKCLIIISVIIGIGFSEAIKFEEGYPFENAEGVDWLSDGKYPTFTHSDWDKDGDKDIIVGYMYTASGTAGHIVYYENTGNDDAPHFEYKMKFPINVGGA